MRGEIPQDGYKTGQGSLDRMIMAGQGQLEQDDQKKKNVAG
jgi:hypothetical protein